jgi:hypothetical protein
LELLQAPTSLKNTNNLGIVVDFIYVVFLEAYSNISFTLLVSMSATSSFSNILLSIFSKMLKKVGPIFFQKMCNQHCFNIFQDVELTFFSENVRPILFFKKFKNCWASSPASATSGSRPGTAAPLGQLQPTSYI